MPLPCRFEVSINASKLVTAASKDPSRASLHSPFVRTVPSLGPCIVATDGHILAAHRVRSLDDSPAPVDGAHIDQSAITAACKAAPKGDEYGHLSMDPVTRATILENGAMYPTPVAPEFMPPDVAQVIPPENRPGSITFRIDPRHMVALLDALGARKDVWIEINVPAPVGQSRAVIEPITVRCATDCRADPDPARLGVIMPVAR